MKPGAFSDIAYEQQLKEKAENERQIFDYLLKTDKLIANKKRKYLKLSDEINRYLDQLDDYQGYTEAGENRIKLADKISYHT